MLIRPPAGYSAEEIGLKYKDYATPLIGPFLRVLREDTLDEKGLLDASESATMYLALAAFAYYQKVGYSVSAISKAVDSITVGPAFGGFTRLLRELIVVFRSDQQSYLMRSLNAFYTAELDSASEEDINYLAECADLEQSRYESSNKGLLDVLVEYRNNSAHEPYEYSRLETKIHTLVRVIDTLLLAVKDVATLPLLEICKSEKDSAQYGINRWTGLNFNKEVATLAEDLKIHHTYIQLTNDDGKIDLIDLFPFYLGLDCQDESGSSHQLCVQNGVKKVIVAYSSYQSGHIYKLTKEHPFFGPVKQGFAKLKAKVASGHEGLPPWIILEVSEESRNSFSRAQADSHEGDIENAIIHLKDAVEKSPVYEEAVKRLGELLERENRLEEAHEVYDQYLGYFPMVIDLQVQDARVLLGLKRYDSVRGKIRRIRDEDPGNSDVLTIEAALDAAESEGEDPDEGKLQATSKTQISLPYEYFINCLCIQEESERKTKPAVKYRNEQLAKPNTLSCLKSRSLIIPFFIIGLTFGEFAFFRSQDLVMGLTLLSMGLLWGAVVWATFFIRKTLEESRSNFAAFLKSKKGIDSHIIFYDLIIPIFGKFQLSDYGLKGIFEGLKNNKFRVLFMFLGAFASSILFLNITKYSGASIKYDIAYGIYIFFVSLSFLYFISCLVLFHRQLNPTRFPDIEFSLVQHPKQSIRYLSHLSRRLSYPQLLIYVLATFTMYLGPFLANIVFIFMLSALLIFTVYSYYNTIILVKRVIVKKKWSLISRFSRHFDKPFNQLIDLGEPSALEKIKQLHSARNFIDSMNVWAESKPVLVGTSILYLAVLLLSTIGLSNAMTLHVVPTFSKYANQKTHEKQTQYIPWPGKAYDNVTLKVEVKDVDDTVIVFWGSDSDELIEKMNSYSMKMNDKDSPSQHPNVKRCDWANGSHGSMEEVINLNGSRKVVIIAYNKIYHGFFYMGGGKLSYDIKAFLQKDGQMLGEPLVEEKAFVRINTKEIGYAAYLDIFPKQNDGSNIQVDKYINNEQLLEQDLVAAIRQVEMKLSEEADASVGKKNYDEPEKVN